MERSTLLKHFITIITFIFVSQTFYAQNKEPKPLSVYKVNLKWEIPAAASFFIFQSYGYSWVNSKPKLTKTEIDNLDANDIWKFDRWATQQDASLTSQAHESSNYIMYGTVALPFFLAFDPQIRKDWLPLSVLYVETHAVNSGLYFLSAGTVDRIRPFAYNPNVLLNDKMSSGTKISFFSGHASTTAVSTFFMAKVYSDYHPELGNKKFWLYGSALVPPIVVGYLRIKAMRHFPTDVITGLAFGAAVGILVPHLHKTKKKNSNYSFIPFMGDVNGLKIRYSIR
jgi:membrane-associated phospholipid phosphatase